jgi:xanthine dehydrogenase YagS FAD-binding subunit
MSFQFVRASDAAAAARFKTTSEGAMFIAGGSGVVDLLSQNVIHPSLLIDLNGLSNRGIDLTPEGSLRIGALTTMAELAWHETVITGYPVLMQALLTGATPQVHHSATVGGRRKSTLTFRSRHMLLRELPTSISSRATS